MSEKTCRDCGETKPVSDFAPKRRRCRQCKRSNDRARFSGSYLTWLNMIARCSRTTATSYANYGGRGIKVCERWLSFENFLADMGERPAGLTIERTDNNGNYEPNNCCWADSKTQSRNRRFCRPISLNGRTQLLTDWAAEIGIGVSTLSMRLDVYKWPVERALATIGGK